MDPKVALEWKNKVNSFTGAYNCPWFSHWYVSADLQFVVLNHRSDISSISSDIPEVVLRKFIHRQ